MRVFGIALLVAVVGCSAKQVREIEADAHATAVVVAGSAAVVEEQVQAHPELAASLADELGATAVKLAAKAGVSAADQATLTQAITPANVQQVATKVKAVATKIAASTPSGTVAVGTSQ